MKPAFANGPEFGHAYHFRVFPVKRDGFYPSVSSAAPVAFLEGSGQAPSSVPDGKLILCDNLPSFEDLSNGLDLDRASDLELVIRWKRYCNTVYDYHVYVSVDGGRRTFLGRTKSGRATFFQWKAGYSNRTEAFNDGPKFGHTYSFTVFHVSPRSSSYAVFRTAGSVLLREDTRPTPTSTPTSTSTPTPTGTFTPTYTSTPSFTPTPRSTPTPPPALTNITINIPGLNEGAKPFEMVLIPAGTFIMGCSPEERGYYGTEWPPHEVTITKPFYLGKYEVTQAQWEAVMGENPVSGVYGIGDDHPVYEVDWNDCQRFIGRLNEWGIGHYRLPTEAEWEYACRAGTATRFYWGDDASDSEIQDYAWYSFNSNNEVREVGQKLPNDWGLYYMSGNVWEWCSDRWQESTDRGAQTDPQGPPTGSECVFRGGGCSHLASHCRPALRIPGSSDLRLWVGLRLAWSYEGELPPPTPTYTPTLTPTMTPTPSFIQTWTNTPTPTFTPSTTNTPIPPLALQLGNKTITIDLPGLPGDATPLEMVLIPAGTFMMGSSPGETGHGPFEGPKHQVTIADPFYMAKYEITNAQFRAFRPNHEIGNFYGLMNPGPGSYVLSSDDQPVVYVEWPDAEAFCEWLTDLTGTWVRLPSEAEWEYACRGESTGERYWGDSEDLSMICMYANGLDLSAANTTYWEYYSK